MFNCHSHHLSVQAAVDAVTRNLALEWGTDYDIRVNGIAPGPIGDTAGMRKLGPEEISNKSKEYMPLYKLGEKYDIAMAALYLASDAGWYLMLLRLAVKYYSYLLILMDHIDIYDSK